MHPDPEGHLTDLTVSKLRDLRDSLDIADSPGEYWAGHRVVTIATLRALNAILEPWGEGPVGD